MRRRRRRPGAPRDKAAAASTHVVRRTTSLRRAVRALGPTKGQTGEANAQKAKLGQWSGGRTPRARARAPQLAVAGRRRRKGRRSVKRNGRGGDPETGGSEGHVQVGGAEQPKRSIASPYRRTEETVISGDLWPKWSGSRKLPSLDDRSRNNLLRILAVAFWLYLHVRRDANALKSFFLLILLTEPSSKPRKPVVRGRSSFYDSYTVVTRNQIGESLCSRPRIHCHTSASTFPTS